MDLDLPAALSDQLESDAGATFAFFDRSSRTFRAEGLAELLDHAAGTAADLESNGLEPGDIAALVASTPEGFWRGYLAAMMARAVPLLVPVRPSLDSEATIARKLTEIGHVVPTARFLIQEGSAGPCVETPLSSIPLHLSGEADDAASRLRRITGDPDRLLHLQLTSGSTGMPKPVVMTHRNVIDSTSASIERTEIQSRDDVVSWLPLYHDMGLMGMAMLSLLSGADLRLFSPFDFLSDPMHWLRAVSESSGAITAAPNFALAYATRRVSDRALGQLDLRGWKKCYCGAEPVDPVTVSEFIERFASVGLSPEAVHPTYGLAEATLMVTMPRAGELPKQLTVARSDISDAGPIDVLDRRPMTEPVTAPAGPDRAAFACLGVPARGVTVEILDRRGDAVADEDFCGEVAVSGSVVSPGYLLPDGTLEPFADRRCRTGDLGFVHDGELYLVERLKNIIIVNGQNHGAGALEQVVAAAASVPLDSCVVMQRSTLDSSAGVVAVVEAPRGRRSDDLVAEILDAVRREDLPITEIRVVRRGQIPRTTSGKKQPAKLRLALADGTLSELARSGPNDDVGARPVSTDTGERHVADDGGVIDLDRDQAGTVFAIIEAHARRRSWLGDRVEATDLLVADLGLDSLALIEVSLDIESQLGRGIGEGQLADLVTAGDVARLVSGGSEPSVRMSDLLDRLVDEVPQVYRRVSAQSGRRVLIDGRWITDFGSLNYLGLDLCPDVIDSVGPALRRWGVHPSWTRAVASPDPYAELELALATLVGAPDAMVFPAITLLHFGVLPKLATSNDTLIVDQGAHNSIHEAAELAQARGATVLSFDHGRLETLDLALSSARGRPVIALNGVYSMSGEVANLAAIHERAVAGGALLYIDDAHGIGILGEGPCDENPYGSGGGGVVRHAGLAYDNIVYVGGLSKAFSSMAAFVTCRDRGDRQLFERASTSIFSGPVPVASLASAQAGLEINRTEGDERRAVLRTLTNQLLSGARERGYSIENHLGFPVVNLTTGGVERTVRASQIMWECGVLFTPSVFPAAPLDQGGFRVSVTVDNTPSQVDQLLSGLDVIAERLGSPPVIPGRARRVPSQ